MNIDRSKFDTLSTEQKIMQLVRIQPASNGSTSYEAVCSICSTVYEDFSGICDGDAWCLHTKKRFAYCDSDYRNFNMVPDSEIKRICEHLNLKFVGFMIGKNIHALYCTDAEAQASMQDVEESWVYGPDYTSIPPRY